MITFIQGNLLKADVEAIINTVNCVGVMGKGIALQFKQAFPKNFDVYAKACKSGQLHPGTMHIFETGNLINPRFIINFPTKTHWRAKSKLEHVEKGLEDLVRVINEHKIKSLAVPPLGCGNGGLAWEVVKPLIESSLSQLQDVDIQIFEPKGAPAVDAMPVGTKKPNMTKARALFVKLIEQYCLPGYRLSLLEIQKLAYFLQEAGEPLRLDYQKHHYGPYAENLNHVLQRIEGHFIRGYGDRSRDAEIHLNEGAAIQANEFLVNDQESEDRLNRIKQLIDGFETPYGVELLSTVHWIVTHEDSSDIDDIILKVGEWNTRKKSLMQPKHIKKAWQQLSANNWLN